MVLPRFLMRDRQQDTACLGKWLAMALGMGLSQRATATMYAWHQRTHESRPGWIWGLVQWLGCLLPVSLLLMRWGCLPPSAAAQ